MPWPGLDEVNAYLLADPQGSTLVDCGMHLPDDVESGRGWDYLVEALAICDHKPEDVRRLVLTHTHIDHYGLAGKLRAETGCEVLMHEAADAELDVLRDPEKAAEELRSTYIDLGVDPDEVTEMTRFEDWSRYVSELIVADRWLSDGDEIGCGGRSWQVVYTPGHARSHVCLFDREASILISGDHLLGAITPHIDFRRGEGDPLGDFLDSLEKVERLRAELVLPGHSRPFMDGAERARATQRHHERRLGAVLQVVRREACTAERITEEIFGRTLLNFQKRLAFGEALAHIHYLLVRGEIEQAGEDEGRRVYRKVSRRRVQEVEE